MIDFLTQNIKTFPGKTLLKFNIIDNSENLKISLYNNEVSILLNDDLIQFLQHHPEVQINVHLQN
jgi:DNA polymerase-3 subunit alpha